MTILGIDQSKFKTIPSWLVPLPATTSQPSRLVRRASAMQQQFMIIDLEGTNVLDNSHDMLKGTVAREEPFA